MFEESLGIHGNRDQFSDRCGDGETNRYTSWDETFLLRFEFLEKDIKMGYTLYILQGGSKQANRMLLELAHMLLLNQQ